VAVVVEKKDDFLFFRPERIQEEISRIIRLAKFSLYTAICLRIRSKMMKKIPKAIIGYYLTDTIVKN
jgi:hypothetical protein